MPPLLSRFSDRVTSLDANEPIYLTVTLTGESSVEATVQLGALVEGRRGTGLGPTGTPVTRTG